VLLNVYDVAQQGDSKLIRLNNLVGPKGLGLGGKVAAGCYTQHRPAHNRLTSAHLAHDAEGRC
jgi:hypothetical protein